MDGLNSEQITFYKDQGYLLVGGCNPLSKICNC